MDCFFASVATRHNVELQSKPVAISHCASPGTGEVSTANYVARQFGVRSGMFLKKALSLCPQLVVLPYEFEKYQEVSDSIYEVFFGFTHRVEGVSIDEAYLEFDSEEIFNSEEGKSVDAVFDTINQIREEIFRRTQCPASAGISHNMFLARIATKKAKPNGVFFLKRESAHLELSQFSAFDLPGIGWSSSKPLKDSNIETCADLMKFSCAELEKLLGKKKGKTIWEYCRGIDRRDLQINHERKSIGVDIGWGVRFENREQVEKFLFELVTELSSRLQSASRKTSAIVLKLKKRAEHAPKEAAKFLGHGICDSLSKSSRTFSATDNSDELYRHALLLLKEFGVPPDDVRALGVSASKLEDSNLRSTSSGTILSFATSRVTPVSPDKEELSRDENAVVLVSSDSEVSVPRSCDKSDVEILRSESSSSKVGRPISNDIMHYFQSRKPSTSSKILVKGKSKKFAFSSSNVRQVPQFIKEYLKSIDWETFDQLPSHIRKQIKQDYELLMKVCHAR
jgi:DNA repair protein REV1